MRTLLELRNVEAFYGRIKALHGVDLSLREGEITALLGANGAGKSTLLRAICAMVTWRGEMHFEGKSIAGKSTEEIVRLGIGHVPEGRATFAAMTVEENLKLGAHVRKDSASVAADLKWIYRMFPVLEVRCQQPAGTLSGGEQQMLAVSRALLLRPKLLLLDEPSLGVAPLVLNEILRAVKEINQRQGVGVLLVEQNARLALELAETAWLLETGRVVASGASANLKQDDTVRRAYLGY
jgi:branched-chain amino acid transport system ATP-binding protein